MRRVVVVPAGRRACLSMLLHYLHRQQAEFDRLDLWVNTTNPKDLEYISSLPATSRVRCVTLSPKSCMACQGTTEALSCFWKYATEQDTVYLRLDDDIVWTEPDAIRKTFEFRLAYPEFWLTGPMVINNAICSYWLQQYGALPPGVFPEVGFCRTDSVGWSDVYFAQWLHEQLVAKIKRGCWQDLYTHQRHRVPVGLAYSINAVAWFGEDMRAAIPHLSGKYEESVMTEIMPNVLDRSICIDGNTLVSHLAYYVQRNHPDYPIEAIWSSYVDLIK